MANGLLQRLGSPRRISVLDSAQGARQLLGGVGAQGLQNEITGLTGGIQQAQLSGQAPEQDSIRRLGQIAPDVKAGFAQAFGIPANEDERLIGFAQDIGVAARLAKSDPDSAYRYIVNRRNELRAFGQDTAKTDQLINEFESGNVDLAVANLDSLSQSLQETGFLPKPEERIIKQSEISPQGQVTFLTPGGGIESRDSLGFRGEEPEPSESSVQKFGDFRAVNKDVGDLVKEAQKIRGAATRLRKIAKTKSPTDQLAAVFTFMKALDPTSVVREGEQQQARSTGGPADQFIGFINKIKGEGALPPEVFEDMVRTAMRLANQASDNAGVQVTGFLDAFGDRIKDKDKQNLQRRVPKLFELQSLAPAATTTQNIPAPTGAGGADLGDGFRIIQ